MKKFLWGALGLTALLAACTPAQTSQTPAPADGAPAAETPAASPEAPAAEATPAPTPEPRFKETLDLPALPQLSEPAEGEDIAVISTHLGVIKIRFFPTDAPKAVENFLTHVRTGYYNGTIFHRVVKDFVIQGGDPLGTGSGGSSIWGAGFETETTLSLHHLRGAVGMARSEDPNSNGSQFYIVQNPALSEALLSEMEAIRGDKNLVIGTDENGADLAAGEIWPEVILDSYVANGGTPQLDYQYTVFGHVIEGMDVVDAIAAVEVNADDQGTSKPLVDVVVEGITLEKYTKQ
jgi:cyclophilin family peptidyl-prolyl cis-trans isomerase